MHSSCLCCSVSLNLNDSTSVMVIQTAFMLVVVCIIDTVYGTDLKNSNHAEFQNARFHL